MTRRPLLTTAALLATLALASCNGSPEAGHPNTAPTSTTPTPKPTAPSTPTYTPDEQAAITAAKARYLAARAAVDQAFTDPTRFDRRALEKAGNGRQWAVDVSGGIAQLQGYGWYRSGKTKITSLQVTSVKLDIEQPEVRLVNCIDTSAVVTRFQKNDKPVPMGPGNGKRHKFSSVMVFATPVGSTTKDWFLVDDTGSGSC